MTIEGILTVISGVAAVAAASAAWMTILLLSRRPMIVADLLARQESLDLVIANIGRGVAYEVSFDAVKTPSAALPGFEKSSLLRYGLSVLAPGREYRVPLLSLTEEFWGKGMQFESPLVLKIAYRRRGVLLRRNCRRSFTLGVGAFSDAAHVRAVGFESIEWGE